MSIFTSTEFFSAVAGAIVGGTITFVCQLYALRAARRQREADNTMVQKALANSLFFKLMRIHSNLHGIHRHFWESLERGQKEMPSGEPWQVVVPLANPPEQVHLQSDEMGMLLSLKNDPVLNGAMDVEAIHNSMIVAVRAFNNERIALGERLASVSELESEVGDRISTAVPNRHRNALRPMMITVNSLVQEISSLTKDGLALSRQTLRGAEGLFRTKFNFSYTVTIKADVDATKQES
jgi:hypothetical protein